MDEDAMPIGEYNCPKCGVLRIYDPKAITIKYPLALGVPVAKVDCSTCSQALTSLITWEDAMMFEQIGAKIDGFTFATAEKLTEIEIDQFIVHIDKEIKEFLDECY